MSHGAAFVGDTLTYSEIGVDQFVTWSQGGLGGLLKYRPSDFVVKEIRQHDGTVVRLQRKIEPLLDSDEGQAHASTTHADDADDERRYLLFTLHKTMHGTVEALAALSRALRVPQNAWGVAGLKDAWAVTTQEVTVPRRLVKEADLARATLALDDMVGSKPCA